RLTGQSLYYPRVMMRTLAQVLTEEYSEHGVHVANVVIDGLIDSPGTRALARAREHPEIVMNPVKIAEAFYYLHTQDRSCWTHELQLTPFSTKPSFYTLADHECAIVGRSCATMRRSSTAGGWWERSRSPRSCRPASVTRSARSSSRSWRISISIGPAS